MLLQLLPGVVVFFGCRMIGDAFGSRRLGWGLFLVVFGLLWTVNLDRVIRGSKG